MDLAWQKVRFPQPPSLGNTRTRIVHPPAPLVRHMPMWLEHMVGGFRRDHSSGSPEAPVLPLPTLVLSLQRKRRVSDVCLVLVRNLRTKTRRIGSLTWFLGLMVRGGVRTRHGQCILTATTRATATWALGIRHSGSVPRTFCR